MTLIPTLETTRLTLRAPAESDLDAESAFFASARSVHVGGPKTREEVWRMIATFLGHWQIRGYGFWAIDEKDSGRYCGRAGLWFPEGWPEPEIGWALMEGTEGRGIAFEAANAARDYAYDILGWDTAISLIAPGNDRSIRLAERLGARFEREYEHPRFGRMRIYRHPAPDALDDDGNVEPYA